VKTNKIEWFFSKKNKIKESSFRNSVLSVLDEEYEVNRDDENIEHTVKKT
jgi:hypothetical protein